MHLNFEQILWAFILAAHLVLLVILLGREQARRFPFFTAAIAVAAVHLLTDHLLNGKLTTLAFYWQTYSLIGVEALIGLLVLIELSRKIFSSGREGRIVTPRGYAGWILVTGAIAAGIVWYWGPWPAWAGMTAQPAEFHILLLVLIATKLQLFVWLATVEIALLIRIFGGRFGFGWRSYPQQIALALSTHALAILTVQIIQDSIKHSVHLTSREQYDHIIQLFAHLDYARSAVWLMTLLWLITWLWRDEPGPTAALGISATLIPIKAELLPDQIPAEGPAPAEDTQSSVS